LVDQSYERAERGDLCPAVYGHEDLVRNFTQLLE